VRAGALFNYSGPLTSNAGYCVAGMKELLQNKPALPLRGFSPSAKSGIHEFRVRRQYRFARCCAPANFNTPEMLEQICATTTSHFST
jgi:hypothetical protein